MEDMVLFWHWDCKQLEIFLAAHIPDVDYTKKNILGLLHPPLGWNRVNQLGLSRASFLRRQFYSVNAENLNIEYKQAGLTLLEYSEPPDKETFFRLCFEQKITKILVQVPGGWEEQRYFHEISRESSVWGIEIIHLPWNTLLQPDELPFSLQAYSQNQTRSVHINGETTMPRNFTPYRIVIEKKELRAYGFSSDRTPLIPWKLASITGRLKESLEAQSPYDRMQQFFGSKTPGEYKETRNGSGPGLYSTKLSPWLAMGSLQAFQLGKSIVDYEKKYGGNESTYWLLFELLWRDFFRFLGTEIGPFMYSIRGFKNHFPSGLDRNVQWKFKEFPEMGREVESESPSILQDYWTGFRAWALGKTGKSFIDGGMTELYFRGTMSNRLRQNTASYLIHDLGIPWWWGAQWFEHHLLDYDSNSNWGNWAYLGGVGADPRESRKFNTDKQAQTYDPNNRYTRWIYETFPAIPQDTLPQWVPKEINS